jgi:hypothetical protein
MKNDQVSDLLNSYIMARTSQQLYHGKNKLNFDEIMMMFALY